MREHTLWVEKYRPHKIEDCILTDELKKTFQGYVDKGEVPNMILYGGPGIGKTTVAKALCDELGIDYLFINGSNESGIDVLRNKMTLYASAMSFDGGRKVIIVDEADYLNPQSTQPALRAFIEEFARNCSFIFTCNYKERLIEALHSRCTCIEFKTNGSKQKMAMEFYKRVGVILDKENIKYDPSSVAALITKYFPDNRRILNELQRYAVSGTIDRGILTSIGELQTKELIKALKDKNFDVVRKWVTNNLDSDPMQLYRKLYDTMYDYLKPESIPILVLIIDKYQTQIPFSKDMEISVLACLITIMTELAFK